MIHFLHSSLSRPADLSQYSMNACFFVVTHLDDISSQIHSVLLIYAEIRSAIARNV